MAHRRPADIELIDPRIPIKTLLLEQELSIRREEQQRLELIIAEVDQRARMETHEFETARYRLLQALKFIGDVVLDALTANNDTVIKVRLSDHAGKIADALVSFEQTCEKLNIAINGRDVMNVQVYAAIEAVKKAANGNCAPVKRYVEESASDKARYYIEELANVPSPGRPKGKTGMRPENERLGQMADQHRQEHPDDDWNTCARQVMKILENASPGSTDWEAYKLLEKHEYRGQGAYLKTQYQRYLKGH